jgi:dienelactone hydrolase
VQQPLTHSQPQGFIGVPPAGNGRDVSVLHAWRGMNGTLRASCTRLAQSAFVAFAPDLHHDEVAEYPADVEALGRALDPNFLQANAEIAEATMALSECVGDVRHNPAVIASSPSTYYALDLAAAGLEQIRAVVIFYLVRRMTHSAILFENLWYNAFDDTWRRSAIKTCATI